LEHALLVISLFLLLAQAWFAYESVIMLRKLIVSLFLVFLVQRDLNPGVAVR
jgi:hypothetical protein